jgi:hypothetical protein
MIGQTINLYASAGTITNCYGLYMTAASTGATVGTSYGIALTPQPASVATNTWAILTNAGNVDFRPLASQYFVWNESGVDSDARFETDANTHALYIDGGLNSVSLLTSSATSASVTLGGNTIFSSDNTYDIGASGATRPRTIYAGTSIDVVAGAVLLETSGITMGDAKNFIVGTTTGTKIGTSTSQKIGLWDATPIVQPSSTGETSGWTSGGGSAATSTDTYTGNSGTKAYTINDVVKHLKACGILAGS